MKFLDYLSLWPFVWAAGFILDGMQVRLKRGFNDNRFTFSSISFAIFVIWDLLNRRQLGDLDRYAYYYIPLIAFALLPNILSLIRGYHIRLYKVDSGVLLCTLKNILHGNSLEFDEAPLDPNYHGAKGVELKLTDRKAKIVFKATAPKDGVSDCTLDFECWKADLELSEVKDSFLNEIEYLAREYKISPSEYWQYISAVGIIALYSLIMIIYL